MNFKKSNMHISNTMSETSKDSGYQENGDAERDQASGDFMKLDNATNHSSRRSVHIDAPSIHLSAETTKTNISLQMDSDQEEHHEIDEKSSVSSEELSNTFSHLPINHIDNDNNRIPFIDTSRQTSVPTPVNLNLRDIIEPLEEWSRVQSGIQERKYPVLPKIGKKKNKSKESGRDNKQFEMVNYNQLDYTREKMENEADFFSDYRINTSCVKETPRQNPLPPIRQNSSMGGFHTKR
ncbi:uncharacterized protein LOC110455575 [Mizuhopecten yessoensis]|uniref:uncharacterized protein LOC110455575 n=1 Tax=Mizuhopecten yessoensis TaxID=6573 RepID=UPI000B45B257|nr:uncharacterized protein LOC110455575 [Mizuhopecten yessoensis]XP_021361438.1 uncharacterized protein LOC110455575 [Mizuhopecten yessoensis]XP_021361439.1 uncharacterized protein LOC110455575 [Mizuhopecten yessoensis]